MQVQAVGFSKGAHFVDGLALVAQIGQFIHQKAKAGSGGQRVHHVELAVGVLFLQIIAGDAGGVVGAGNAAGKRQMQHVLAFLEETFKVGGVFFGVDMGGAGIRAIRHGLIELVKGDGLAQIVAVGLAIQHEVEADVVDITRSKMLGAQVGGGAAAQNEISHGSHSLSVGSKWFTMLTSTSARKFLPEAVHLRNKHASAPGRLRVR